MLSRDATSPFVVQTEQGTLRGRMMKSPAGFEIEGEGVSEGITEARARVVLRGRVVGTDIRIQYSQHR